MQFTFTDGEASAIANALGVAAERYEEHGRELPDGRLAAQFRHQAAEARELADRLAWGGAKDEPELAVERNEPLRVLIALEGGCVSAVIINRPGVELVSLDYDTEGADEADLFDIPQDGGGTAQAWRSIGECEHDQTGFFERARDAQPSDPEARLAMLRSNAAGLTEAGGKSPYGRELQREIAALEAAITREEAEASA